MGGLYDSYADLRAALLGLALSLRLGGRVAGAGYSATAIAKTAAWR
jgi:hypothetical protein